MGIETAAIVAAGAAAAGSAVSAGMGMKAQMDAANSADARLAGSYQRNTQLQDRAIEYQTPELDRFQRMMRLMETNATDTVARNEGPSYGNIMRLLNPAVGGTTNLDGNPLGRGATIAATGAAEAAQNQELAALAALTQRQGAFLGSEATGYGRIAAGIAEDRASLEAHKGAAKAAGIQGIINPITQAPLDMMMASSAFGGGGGGLPAGPLPAGQQVSVDGQLYRNTGIQPGTVPGLDADRVR